MNWALILKNLFYQFLLLIILTSSLQANISLSKSLDITLMPAKLPESEMDPNTVKDRIQLSSVHNSNVLACSSLQRYPLSLPLNLSFLGGEEPGFCKWYGLNRRALNKCVRPLLNSPAPASPPPQLDDKKTDQKVDPVAGNFFLPELKISGGEEFQKNLILVNELKKDVGGQCCRGDKDCLTAFSKIEIRPCTKDLSPYLYMRCLLSSVYYTPGYFTTIGRAKISKLQDATEDILGKDQTKSEFSELSTKIYKYQQTFSSIEKGFNALAEWNQELPILGTIALSSNDNWDGSANHSGLNVGVNTLIHELSHACDDLKSQLWVKTRKDNSSKAELGLAAQLSLTGINSSCSATPNLKNYYKTLFEEQGVEPKAFNCIEQSIAESVNPQGNNPCPKACEKTYYAEAFAETMQMLNFNFLNFEVQSASICRGWQDETHPAYRDLFECLLEYSPRFRVKYRKAFSCSQ